MLTRLKLAAPDAIALYTVGADQINFIRQYRGFGMGAADRPHRAGGLQAEHQERRINGATSVFQYAAELDTPANQAFVKAYKDKYKEDPLLQSAISYENIQLLADAIKRAGRSTARRCATPSRPATTPR